MLSATAEVNQACGRRCALELCVPRPGCQLLFALQPWHTQHQAADHGVVPSPGKPLNNLLC